MLTNAMKCGYAESLKTHIGGKRPCQIGDFFAPGLRGFRSGNILNTGHSVPIWAISATPTRKVCGILKTIGDKMKNQLVFKSHTFEPLVIGGKPYLGVGQIDLALNYPTHTTCRKIYERHADEFSPDMSFLTTVDTAGGKQQVRVFSLRGCHLLAMFSKTPVAKEFRHWVLDLIEQHNRQIKPALVDKRLENTIRDCVSASVRDALKITDKPFDFNVWHDIIVAALNLRTEQLFKEYKRRMLDALEKL